MKVTKVIKFKLATISKYATVMTNNNALEAITLQPAR